MGFKRSTSGLRVRQRSARGGRGGTTPSLRPSRRRSEGSAEVRNREGEEGVEGGLETTCLFFVVYALPPCNPHSGLLKLKTDGDELGPSLARLLKLGPLSRSAQQQPRLDLSLWTVQVSGGAAAAGPEQHSHTPLQAPQSARSRRLLRPRPWRRNDPALALPSSGSPLLDPTGLAGMDSTVVASREERDPSLPSTWTTRSSPSAPRPQL